MNSYLLNLAKSSEISETLKYVARINGQGCVFDIGDMGVDRKDCLEAGQQLGFEGDTLQTGSFPDAPPGCFVTPDDPFFDGAFSPQYISYNSKYPGKLGNESYYSICQNLKNQGECISTNAIEMIEKNIYSFFYKI